MQPLFILYQCLLQREGSSHLGELGLSRLIDGTLWQEELQTAYSVLNCSSANCLISCVLETNKSLWQQQQQQPGTQGTSFKTMNLQYRPVEFGRHLILGLWHGTCLYFIYFNSGPDGFSVMNQKRRGCGNLFMFFIGAPLQT